MLGVVDAVLARASVMTGYAGIFSCDGWDLLLFLWAWKWFLLLGRVAFLRASCDFRQVIPSTKCRTLRGATLSTLHWATGAALWIPDRRCRPVHGSKTESHALGGMAFCFGVHGGAFGCTKYGAGQRHFGHAVRVCTTEHQLPKLSSASSRSSSSGVSS